MALNESLGHALVHHLPPAPHSLTATWFVQVLPGRLLIHFSFFWRKRGKTAGDGIFNAFCNLQRSIFICFRGQQFHCKAVHGMV